LNGEINGAMLSFPKFFQISKEQWCRHTGPRRLFTRIFGQLGMNARLRAGKTINAFLNLDLPAQAEVLDAGCGMGCTSFWLAQDLPGHRFSAVDIDLEEISRNQQIARTLKLTNLTFAAQSIIDLHEIDRYDIIFSADVLEHVVDDEKALQLFHQALKREGYLLLHLPKRYEDARRIFPGFDHFDTPDHVRDEYTRDEITRKLNRNGFEIVQFNCGYGFRGELAMELNYLFWPWQPLRLFFGLIFFPLCLWLAYQDVSQKYSDGNSFMITARLKNGSKK